MKNILYEKNERIATVTINRPDKLNALNQETVREIMSAMNTIEEDENVRVVIITGAGDRAFCAGADIGEMKNKTPIELTKSCLRTQEMMNKIAEFDKPVIAAINGYALGGGLELAMSCDLRIASEKARLGQPEINIGLIPGWGGTQRLPRFVGRAKAKEMIFTGRMIDAKTAKELSLLNEVVSADQLETQVKQLADELSSKPPIAIKLAKQLINNSMETNLRIGMMYESEAFGILGSTEDVKEGIGAFLEKRKPNFKGK